MKIALKVDVDTYRGMGDGLPALLDFFRAENIKSSIFVSFGPDESGKAVKRIFRKGFLKKMFRTNAAKLYGFRTMLYGTLLPAPQVGNSFPDLVRRAAAEGHEVGIHAWSHVAWQDELDALAENEIDSQLEQAVAAYRKMLRADPPGFAAPAWKVNKRALRCLLKRPWKYFSLARGSCPVYPKINELISYVPEIPTTMPTLDEILAWDGMTQSAALDRLSAAPRPGAANVYTLHTEAEGMAYLPFFKELVARWRRGGAEFRTMESITWDLNRRNTSIVELEQGELEGRAGEVALV